MSALAEFFVGLLASIPGAVAGLDDASRARILAALDEAKRGLTAIGPNAPAVREAAERRRADLERERTERGDEKTAEQPLPGAPGKR